MLWLGLTEEAPMWQYRALFLPLMLLVCCRPAGAETAPTVARISTRPAARTC